MYSRQQIGQIGEAAVIRYARSIGWILLARRFRTWEGEIDSIFWDGQEVVFVEVKTRQHGGAGLPEEQICESRVDRIYDVAADWLAVYRPNSQWKVQMAAVRLSQKRASIQLFDI